MRKLTQEENIPARNLPFSSASVVVAVDSVVVAVDSVVVTTVSLASLEFSVSLAVFR